MHLEFFQRLLYQTTIFIMDSRTSRNLTTNITTRDSRRRWSDSHYLLSPLIPPLEISSWQQRRSTTGESNARFDPASCRIRRMAPSSKLSTELSVFQKAPSSTTFKKPASRRRKPPSFKITIISLWPHLNFNRF